MQRIWHQWAILALCAAGSLPAQEFFDSSPSRQLLFHPSDSAVLAAGDNRTDLDCRVQPQAPRLGFDLKFTVGYVIQVPAETVSSEGDDLRVLFRVQPIDDKGLEAVYFRQSFNLPPHRADAGGSATFPGRFVVGPGQYKIDWLMRNLQGRVCSSHWTATARMPPAAARLAAAAPANLILPYGDDTFAEEPPVARQTDSSKGLHVSLLVNLAPLDRNRFKLNDYELDSIVGMLRSLHREPSIGLFSLTAFNAYDRQVVYTVRQQTRLDFVALGEALDAVPAGTVDIDALTDLEGDQRFLAGLLFDTIGPTADPPDAVLIIGPKVDREASIEDVTLATSLPPGKLFSFSFNRNPHSYPWPGAIEAALKPLGLIVSTVTRPVDFSRALSQFLVSVGSRAAAPQPH